MAAETAPDTDFPTFPPVKGNVSLRRRKRSNSQISELKLKGKIVKLLF